VQLPAGGKGFCNKNPLSSIIQTLARASLLLMGENPNFQGRIARARPPN
jgi:hypothetical protein